MKFCKLLELFERANIWVNFMYKRFGLDQEPDYETELWGMNVRGKDFVIDQVVHDWCIDYLEGKPFSDRVHWYDWLDNPKTYSYDEIPNLK